MFSYRMSQKVHHESWKRTSEPQSLRGTIEHIPLGGNRHLIEMAELCMAY